MAQSAIAVGQSNAGSYRFLEVPTSVLSSALGGTNVSRDNRDNNLITYNPSLVGDSLIGDLSINYLLYPGDVKISNVTYTTGIRNTGNWTFNLVYFNYGKIDGYDITGAGTGTFSANEYAVAVGKSHRIENYTVGATFRVGHSTIAGNTSTAIFTDLGGSFIHPEKDFTVGLSIRNLGVVIDDYSSVSQTRLPIDVQVGTSFKPPHMPFRFSLTGYRLTDWSSATEETSAITGVSRPSTVDQLFRHLLIGTEVLIGKYVVGIISYNHRRRRELRSESGGGAGFSYGLLVNVRNFEFGYSRATYHIAGASNTFTLVGNMNQLIRKKKTIQ